MLKIDKHPDCVGVIGGVDQSGASNKGVAVSVKHRVDHCRQQRMARCDKFGAKQIITDRDSVFVECDSFIDGLNMATYRGFTFTRTHNCRNPGDFKPAGFARRNASTKIVERRSEERLNKPGSKFAS